MVVQLLGFATKESAAALACWLQWLSAMATRDTTTSYAVRLRLHAHNASKVASPDRGALWKARLAWVSSVLGRPSADAEAVLFSDLDVIPLRPYSALLDKACAPDNSPKFTNSWYGPGRPGIGCPTSSLLQPPQVYHLSSDILFMREMPVNAGFYVIPRNNERTRWLLQEWIRANDVVPDDQIALRRLLLFGLNNTEGRKLRWSRLTGSEVGGFTRNSASNMTFAFHAIHAATLEAKLGRVREAIAASGTSMVGRCQPSDSADADPKARATRSQDNRGQPAGADPMFRSLQAGVAASELLVQQMLAASGERSTEWLLLLRSSGGAAQLRAQLTTKALASMAGESDFVVEYSSELVRPVARTGSGDQNASQPLAACRHLRRYRDSTGTNHLSICRTDLPAPRWWREDLRGAR